MNQKNQVLQVYIFYFHNINGEYSAVHLIRLVKEIYEVTYAKGSVEEVNSNDKKNFVIL